MISTANDTYGQAADSMIDATSTKASFSVNRFNIDSWAVAFMGELAARSGSETTVTDEVVRAVLGEMAKLANFDVSSLAITHTSGTPTYVLNTDYLIVDAGLGMVKFLETGSITDNTDVHADYTAAAPTGWLLDGGVNSSKFLRVWGRGINRFNNKRALVMIPRCSVKPGGSAPFSIIPES